MADKNIIPVSVESRFIALGDHSPVVAGNVGVDYISLTLDSEWEGYNVHVTFAGSGEETTTVDYGGTVGEAWECVVPWEQIADDCELTIGIQALNDDGDEVLNTQAMRIPIYVLESGEGAGAEAQQPTAGTLQRVEQDIKELESLVTDAPEVIASIKDALSGAESATAAANDAATAATSATEAAKTATDSATTAAATATEKAAGADTAASAANSAATAATEATAAAKTATEAAQAVADDVAGNVKAAKQSADDAAASATSASDSAAAAAKSATEAATSQAGASTSAVSASKDAATATSSSNSAASSATAASGSATAAAKSAETAKGWADKAQSIVDFTLEDAVTADSGNPVTSKGIYSYVSGAVEQLRKGLVQIVTELPSTGESGVIYMVLSESGKAGDMYSEYVWTGTAWEKLGDVQMPDLSPYAKTNDVTAMLAGYVTSSTLDGYATTAALAKKQDALTFDGTPTDGSANPVTSTGIKSYIDAIHSAMAAVATTGSYADLVDAPSLATVATSGKYADLTGTPTLNNTYVFVKDAAGNQIAKFERWSTIASNYTATLPNATTSKAGLMSAADKAKLDAITDGDTATF